MAKQFISSVFLIAVLAVAGCASKPSPVGPGLQALKGENIRMAINYLGYPDQTQSVIGDTVYTWSARGTYTDVYPVIDRDRDRVNINGQRKTIERTTRTYVSEVNSYSCKIKIATAGDDLIKSAQAASSGGGCRAYDPVFEQILLDNGITLESLEKNASSL